MLCRVLCANTFSRNVNHGEKDPSPSRPRGHRLTMILLLYEYTGIKQSKDNTTAVSYMYNLALRVVLGCNGPHLI